MGNYTVPVQSASSGEYRCQVSEIPFPISGKFPFEDGFSKHSLNTHLSYEIKRVEEFMAKTDAFQRRTVEYLSALQNRLSNNQLLLQKRINRDPHFSPMQCVRMRDIDGLKLIAANRWGDVNAFDSRGRAPLHFAAAGDDPEIVRILLLHEDIEPKLATRTGKTPVDLAKVSSIQSLFE